MTKDEYKDRLQDQSLGENRLFDSFNRFVHAYLIAEWNKQDAKVFHRRPTKRSIERFYRNPELRKRCEDALRAHRRDIVINKHDAATLVDYGVERTIDLALMG